jgi:hypothetical protein
VQRRGELDDPVKGPRIRVEQKFVWIEPKTCVGLVRPGDAEAVGLTRANAGNETMPDAAVILGKWKLCLMAFGIEEAEVHTVGTLCAHREVGPAWGRRRPEGKPIARQYRGRPDLADIHGSTMR